MPHGRTAPAIAALIEGVRRNEIAADPAGPLGVIAGHREADGTLLAPRIAAVELLNLLRPTVAVAVYITFIAHALTRHPDARDAVAAGGEVEAGDFLQEVRRYYPFFPAQVALVRRSFEYRGHVLQAGSQALLDLYGTSHHPDLWSEPDRFRPDRFRNWSDDGFSLIPQGGGDAATGHRCPGEGIALALMNAALDRLTRGMTYDVPAQELELDFSRLPALPRSRLVISRVSPDRIARR
jgi:fatty-acid peroxygenase